MQSVNHNEELSKEALFDSLGHPLRIKILESVKEAPLAFSEIKRKVGIESSGHLTFHLDKLKGLVRTNMDSNYELTDDGKEALRLISFFNANVKEHSEPKKNSWMNSSNTVWAVAIIAIVVISAVSISCGHAMNLALRDEQGKQRTYGLFWVNIDNARVGLNDAVAAIGTSDYSTARSDLAKADAYLDIIVFQSSEIIALGQDFAKLSDEGLHYLYLLKPTLDKIDESLVNESVSQGQVTFLENLALALYTLRESMQHAEGGPYTIADVDGKIYLFEALVGTGC